MYAKAGETCAINRHNNIVAISSYLLPLPPLFLITQQRYPNGLNNPMILDADCMSFFTTCPSDTRQYIPKTRMTLNGVSHLCYL